jgi:hypothetical protein
VSKTVTRSTDVALVVVPVAQKNRALAFSFDRFGFERN